MKCRAPVRVLCLSLSRRLSALAGLTLFLLAGCATPDRNHSYGSDEPAIGRGAPNWVGQPDGWSKLEEIDRWLAADARYYEPYWRIQGELALSDGRSAYAREELDREGTKTNRWGFRVESARSGYERVIADPLASPAQLELARAGLSRLARMEGGSATPIPPGGVLPRTAWRARTPVPSRLTVARGSYDRITVHHTADVPGARFDGSLADSVTALRNVQRNHMDNRRYGDIGYHYLIDPAGRVYLGRDLAWQGAHAGGINNRQNIGICLLGNFENTRPTSESLSSLTRLLGELRDSHRIPASAVFGHRHWKNTLCPGAHLASWVNNYQRKGPSTGGIAASARPASAKRSPSSKSSRAPSSYSSSGAVR